MEVKQDPVHVITGIKDELRDRFETVIGDATGRIGRSGDGMNELPLELFGGFERGTDRRTRSSKGGDDVFILIVAAVPK